jgi:DNA-directed RNA polymerase specialized sigma24 family protein
MTIPDTAAVIEQILAVPRARLIAWARDAGAPDADLEDVVQEALVSAMRSAGTFSAAKATVGTWLSQIVRHRAWDLRRARSGSRTKNPRTFVLLDHPEREDAEPGAHADAVIRRHAAPVPVPRLAGEVAALTDEALMRLERLTPKEHDAIVAWAHTDAPAEAEAALGMTPRSYEGHLARARRRLVALRDERPVCMDS